MLSCSGISEEIRVPLDGDIQAAIDRVSAKGGGTVQLAEGTYTLRQPLWLKDNVCLAGRGRKTILISDSKTRTQAIGTKLKTLENVTIKNMSVIGPGKRDEMTKRPKGPSGKGPMGIFMNFETGKGKHFKLENLYVSLWECHGVHLKGVAGLTITKCHVDYSSAFNSLYHNVYLRRVSNVKITENLFTDSPVGNGFQVSFGKDISITDNTATGNAGHGIRVAACDNVRIENNTVLKNRGGAGIWLNCEKKINNTNIAVSKNTVKNNTQIGVAVQNTHTALIKENIVLDNGTDFKFRNAFGITLRKNQYRTTKEEKNNSVIRQQV